MDNNPDANERITRLEERIDRNKAEIEDVKRRQNEQHTDMKSIATRLDTINDTISHGQWIIIGAVGFFALESVGLSEFIKKALF